MRAAALFGVLFLLLAGGILLDVPAAQGGNTMTMTLDSSAFTAGGEIPMRYTGEGEDLSPPLSWSGAPSGTKSFVLIVDDPDAPDPSAPKMTWVHWVLYNVPPSVSALAEGGAGMPRDAGIGINDSKNQAYNGPHPPVGRHRYYFKLYALDATLPFSKAPSKAEVEKAMHGHVLAQATLLGTYELRKR